MGVLKRMVFLLVGVLVLALAACTQVETAAEDETVNTPGPETGVDATPVSPGEDVGAVDSYEEFVNAVGEQGLTVEPAGEVTQPFFPVDGRLITVAGADVQVFEFADEEARRATSDTIAENGTMIGQFAPEWVDTPNFWAQGRIIVLYVGQDPQVIDAITQILGEPLTTSAGGVGGEAEPGLPPAAALAAQRALAELRNLSVEQIEIVDVEQAQWPDACLGLPQEGEMCAQVISRFVSFFYIQIHCRQVTNPL